MRARDARISSKGSKQQAQPKKGMPVSDINRDIRALNASILIISQKMKYLVRNEKILGRNLLVLNKKLKQLESGGSAKGGVDETQFSELRDQLAYIKEKVEGTAAKLSELQAEIETVKENYAKDASLKEMKYVIDSINPLEFVTYKEVERLVEEKLNAGKKSKS